MTNFTDLVFFYKEEPTPYSASVVIKAWNNQNSVPVTAEMTDSLTIITTVGPKIAEPESQAWAIYQSVAAFKNIQEYLSGFQNITNIREWYFSFSDFRWITPPPIPEGWVETGTVDYVNYDGTAIASLPQYTWYPANYEVYSNFSSEYGFPGTTFDGDDLCAIDGGQYDQNMGTLNISERTPIDLSGYRICVPSGDSGGACAAIEAPLLSKCSGYRYMDVVINTSGTPSKSKSDPNLYLCFHQGPYWSEMADYYLELGAVGNAFLLNYDWTIGGEQIIRIDLANPLSQSSWLAIDGVQDSMMRGMGFYTPATQDGSMAFLIDSPGISVTLNNMQLVSLGNIQCYHVRGADENYKIYENGITSIAGAYYSGYSYDFAIFRDGVPVIAIDCQDSYISPANAAALISESNGGLIASVTSDYDLSETCLSWFLETQLFKIYGASVPLVLKCEQISDGGHWLTGNSIHTVEEIEPPYYIAQGLVNDDSAKDGVYNGNLHFTPLDAEQNILTGQPVTTVGVKDGFIVPNAVVVQQAAYEYVLEFPLSSSPSSSNVVFNQWEIIQPSLVNAPCFQVKDDNARTAILYTDKLNASSYIGWDALYDSSLACDSSRNGLWLLLQGALRKMSIKDLGNWGQIPTRAERSLHVDGESPCVLTDNSVGYLAINQNGVFAVFETGDKFCSLDNFSTAAKLIGDGGSFGYCFDKASGLHLAAIAGAEGSYLGFSRIDGAGNAILTAGETISPIDLSGAEGIGSPCIGMLDDYRIGIAYANRLFASEDGGLTWTAILANVFAFQYGSNSFACDPSSRIIYFAQTCGTTQYPHENGSFQISRFDMGGSNQLPFKNANSYSAIQSPGVNAVQLDAQVFSGGRFSLVCANPRRLYVCLGNALAYSDDLGNTFLGQNAAVLPQTTQYGAYSTADGNYWRSDGGAVYNGALVQ